MKVLLDTHALLWFCEGSPRLSHAARNAIEHSDNERYVSNASAWEIAIKLSLGKLELLIPFDDLLPGVLAANGLIELKPTFKHYRALLRLPMHHRDPFDRLLVAQARVKEMTLTTCDGSMSCL
jgi:PIN domain nuclease of toxin-antitoxin system